jgi:hypothetical protein
MTARSSLARVEAALSALGEFPQWQGGDRLRVRGVCHDGRKVDTLAVRYEATAGRVLLHCHGGCDLGVIVGALGLSRADLFDSTREGQLRVEPRAVARRPAPRVTVFDPAPAGWSAPMGEWTPCGHGLLAEYVYVDEADRVVFGVTRCPRKCFAQWRPDPARRGGRRWRLRERDRSGAVVAEVRPVLYRLPDVRAAAERGELVWLVEGEKDADACALRGLVATTASSGVSGWRAEYTAQLDGARVRVVADRDVPGRRRAEQVVEALRYRVASLDVVVAADGCKDPFDHFAAGHTVADFLTVWTPVQAGIERP